MSRCIRCNRLCISIYRLGVKKDGKPLVGISHPFQFFRKYDDEKAQNCYTNKTYVDIKGIMQPAKNNVLW